MKEFKTAAMDSATLLYSCLFGVICIGTVILLIFLRESGEMLLWFPIVILIVAPVSAWLMIPKISLDATFLQIQNSFVNIKIRLSDVKNVEKLEKIGYNIRTFGVGGLFGYFGYFNGNDIWYVTNVRKKIKITMKSGKIYMLSPEDPEEFILEIQRNRASLP